MSVSVKTCPFCAEEIQIAAIYCKHCKKDLITTSSSSPSSHQPMIAKGVNGQIELLEHKICIRRKGFLAFMSHGFSGDKEIMLNSITSIQFKKAGMLTSGFIQFAFKGGSETKLGLWDAGKDENTVTFIPEQQSQFAEIKDRIEQYLSRNSH